MKPKALTAAVVQVAAQPIKTIPPQPHCRVLKIGTCQSLSGKSQLTYHVGCTTEGEPQIHFRVTGNTGSGFYSQEWVSLAVIQQEFSKVPAGETITSLQRDRLLLCLSVS